MSDLGKHPAFGSNKGHSVRHAICLPQGSDHSKRNCLPTVHAISSILRAMEIGDRIRKARLSAGLTQRELASVVGVTHGLVGQWESHRKVPGRDNLKKIADATLMDMSALLKDVPEGETGVWITDPRALAMLRRWLRLSRRQQDNLLELINVAADVRREIEQEA